MSVAPSISIIIPVLNESHRVNELISHLYSLEGSEQAEIIVVDGSLDKGTLEAIRDVETIKIRSLQGRGRQMNEGAKIAQGNSLVFLHADTELPHNALMLVRAAMENTKYVAGAFDLGIQSERLLFRLIERFASIRSRITRIPFGDQAIFIRKDYFNTIGGYQEIPLMEDVEIMMRVRKRGDPISIIRQKVSTSPRRWEREGILFCTIRNWFLQILYFLGVSPERLKRFYRHI
jgi:rSAM/selenodomain-associated transferase 2